MRRNGNWFEDGGRKHCEEVGFEEGVSLKAD